MKKILLVLAFLGALAFLLIERYMPKEKNEDMLENLKSTYVKKYEPPVDHAKFTQLQKQFNSAQEVTAACISCHNKTAVEVMRSNHWNWEREEYVKGRGIVKFGKRNALNNFCIGTQGNEGSCAKCHIGLGINKDGIQYTDATNIDCMVCHDNTETYAKGNELGGAPDPKVDLVNVAQHVGRPKRTNCGVCHFLGGGGNNVKHGDLETAMFEPSKEVDVHMASDNPNLQCVDCHKTKKHNISGKMYSLSSMNHNRASCEECHGAAPHDNSVLNEHTLKVACQSCHIPVYAKVNATKMEWDWSTAGRLKDGEPYEEDDKDGNHTYLSIKGSFKWAKNVKPDYIWFNGNATHYLLGDKVDDTSKVLDMNKLDGSYADEGSKIIPVKIHVAKQPFDPVNKILIQPKLYADKKGEGAFWKDFDWSKSAEIGMKQVGLPFSGQISFIKTRLYWPLNHMVSSKENSVKCNECHVREDGRLAGLNDFYMPGRDYSSVIEIGGKLLITLTLFGVIIHSLFRVYSSYRRKEEVK